MKIGYSWKCHVGLATRDMPLLVVLVWVWTSHDVGLLSSYTDEGLSVGGGKRHKSKIFVSRAMRRQTMDDARCSNNNTVSDGKRNENEENDDGWSLCCGGEWYEGGKSEAQHSAIERDNEQWEWWNGEMMERWEGATMRQSRYVLGFYVHIYICCFHTVSVAPQ